MIAYAATLCFALAVLHTFSCRYFHIIGSRYREGSVGENFFHLLGEIEVVFGLWAAIFILFFMAVAGTDDALTYLNARNFTEPLFVFAIMTICASRPIITLAESLIRLFSKMTPMNANLGFFCSIMVIGPLLGSFITEPAAMTVTALILLRTIYSSNISTALRYATLGLLFVNISIGGTLTPYAAPPVLMVAPQWGWDLSFMLTHFGWKAVVAVSLSTSLVAFRFRNEIKAIKMPDRIRDTSSIPLWVTAVHLLILFMVVLSSHHTVVFIGIFLFFLGAAAVTKEYQTELKLKESLLVGFFLGGLVVLGGFQSWWLTPLLTALNTGSLFVGAIGLTAITDNAAITYLGGQVANLSESSRYALVAGSVVGGGLTVIANAPNPAGFSMLNPAFGENGISALLLFRSALIPTLIAAFCFWFL